MKVALNVDDFSVVNNRLDLFLRLKEHFPSFKVSMFMIPIDKKLDYGPYCNRKDFLTEIKRNLDWIQIIPHGLVHDRREARKWDYELFKHKIFPEIRAEFESMDLPYEKGFKAPHWDWNEGVVKYLDEIGWWGAVLRDDFKPMPTTKKFYKFTHMVNENFWDSSLPVLKLHSHMYGTKNDIGKCYDNLMKLPKDTQFDYVTQHIETL